VWSGTMPVERDHANFQYPETEQFYH